MKRPKSAVQSATPSAAATPPIQSVAFVSLGCPKNLVDSERMLGLLAQDGLAITPDHESADAIIINTCGFLEASKEESLGEIRRAVELKKSGACQRVMTFCRPGGSCLMIDVSRSPKIDRAIVRGIGVAVMTR